MPPTRGRVTRIRPSGRTGRSRSGPAWIRRLTEIEPGVTWREAEAVGERVEAAVDLLRQAVERGGSPELVGISEFALQRAEQAIMEVQDSEYWSRGVLDDLWTLHRRACAENAPPF